MSKWNLIVDVDRCNNCNNCFLAVKDEHGGNEFRGYAAPQPAKGARWFYVERQERGQAPMLDASHYPVTCNHCDNAPCMTDKTRGVVIKRPDGIVIIDPKKAKDRRDIVDLCPYGQIQWNEELRIPQKWIFEAHLLDKGWKEPRVSQVCPTGAITAVKMSDHDMQLRVEREKLQVLRPELKAKPRVYYKNFGRVNTCFIGGSVSQKCHGAEDCVAGLEVELWRDETCVARHTTDVFGEFKFDGLPPDGGAYAVRFPLPLANGGEVPIVHTTTSQYLGNFCLAIG